MMMVFFVIAIVLIWGISVRRRLAGMNENINQAMNQIGVQLSSRFDALTAWINLLKGYDEQESENLMEIVTSKRNKITAASSPEEVQKQERTICDARNRILAVSASHPEIKTNENHVKCMNALEKYEKMACTNRLIYNDHVTRLNRELHMFPTFLLAGIFGFHERAYIEAVEGADLRGIKNIITNEKYPVRTGLDR